MWPASSKISSAALGPTPTLYSYYEPQTPTADCGAGLRVLQTRVSKLAQSFAFEVTLGKRLNLSGSQLAYCQSRTSSRGEWQALVTD